MKQFACLCLFTALTSVAAIVDFNLSPPGTDKAVGVSPLNEVPPATNSVGSGGELPPGIFLDTNTRQLGFAIGYGSSAGFTDMTGPATAMHFHAPAGPGTNASVSVSLVPFHIPAANPANGGQILGSVILNTNQFNQILNGLFYFNIHTAT
ncbi:MAG: CHRD domain-containing protein, partial [Verrucomicrobia bacterium]